MPKALAGALAGVAEAHIDLDALLAIAATARTPPAAPPPAAAEADAGAREADAGPPAEGVPAGLGAGEPWPRARIGVARDAAFGFYYAECAPCAVHCTTARWAAQCPAAYCWATGACSMRCDMGEPCCR